MYIGKLKDKLDYLRSKEKLAEPIIDSDEISRMKNENEILKHVLEITNLKLSLKEDDSKIESDLKSKNLDLRSHITRVIFELDSIKIEHVELEKYNVIVKDELAQAKKQLEKLYFSSEKIDEQLS